MNLDNMVSKKDLGQALEMYQDVRIKKTYPPVEVCKKEYIVNEKTDKKIRKLIEQEKKSYFILINTAAKKVACFIIVLLIASTTTIFSVEALREPFVDYVLEFYEKYVAVYFKDDELTTELIDEFCEPAYLPDGFVKTEERTDYFSYECEYEFNGKVIVFTQMIDSNGNININSEVDIFENIDINGNEAIYSEKYNEGSIFLKSHYVYIISGEISKEELIKVAESIEIKK